MPAWTVAPWRNVVDLKYTCVIKEYTKYTTFIQGGHAASWSPNTEEGRRIWALLLLYMIRLSVINTTITSSRTSFARVWYSSTPGEGVGGYINIYINILLPSSQQLIYKKCDDVKCTVMTWTFVCSSIGASGHSWTAPAPSEAPPWRRLPGFRSTPSGKTSSRRCQPWRRLRPTPRQTPSTNPRAKAATARHPRAGPPPPGAPARTAPSPNWSWWCTTGSKKCLQDREKAWHGSQFRKQACKEQALSGSLKHKLGWFYHLCSGKSANWDSKRAPPSDSLGTLPSQLSSAQSFMLNHLCKHINSDVIASLCNLYNNSL